MHPLPPPGLVVVVCGDVVGGGGGGGLVVCVFAGGDVVVVVGGAAACVAVAWGADVVTGSDADVFLRVALCLAFGFALCLGAALWAAVWVNAAALWTVRCLAGAEAPQPVASSAVPASADRRSVIRLIRISCEEDATGG